MSVKEYRFFGQVQEVNDIGETTDAGWSVFCTWVKQEDYARLKAEVERLTAEVSYDKRVQLHVDKLAAEFTQAEVDRLKAEVERLTKAGDALYENHLEGMQIVGWEVEDCPLMMAWNAAKEGKQS